MAPSATKSDDARLKPIINTFVSLPSQNHKLASQETKNSTAWKPLQKQTMHQTEESPLSLTGPNGPSKAPVHNAKIAALQAIRQKFLPKEITTLPWDKYKTDLLNANEPQVEKKQNKHRYGNQYDQMIEDLALSQAQLVAAKYQKLTFVEADNLAKKTIHLKERLDTMYEQLRVNVNTTRASVKSLCLSHSQIMEVSKLKEHVCHTEKDLEEFYFMNKYANHVETRYLQHLAGTLLGNNHISIERQSSHIEKQEIDNDKAIFLNILHQLRGVLNEESKDEWALPLLSSSSSTLHTSVSSSSSAATSSLCGANTNTLLSADQSNFEISQEISTLIERISCQNKRQKDTIQSFELQSKNTETIEELMKQRERSAELVLQLEKNRSQRLLLSKKKEIEMTNLKQQLSKEILLRKSLESRVTTLEQELVGKEMLINSYDLELRNLKDQNDNNKFEIRELRSEQQEWKKKCAEVDRELLSQSKLEKLEISDQYSSSNYTNLENVVVQMKLKCKQDQEKINSLERDLDGAQSRMVDLQATLDQLVAEKECLIAKSNIAMSKCQGEIEIDKEDMVSVVGSVHTAKAEGVTITNTEENRAGQHRVKHSNSLIRLKQQELNQLQQKCDSVIKLYTTRESAYILQSASTEAELERLLKEYDRLTRNITDFNNERKKFEDEIRELQSEKIQLSRQLCDEKIIKIYGNDGALCKEFRDLMATVKEKHKEDLLKELDARRKVEHMLREKMSEVESRRWEKVDTAVQTHFHL